MIQTNTGEDACAVKHV